MRPRRKGRCAIRIVSLLPSATEIVYSLGLDDQLVGVSHQCDYPPDARRKPVLTAGRLRDEGMSSVQVDAQAETANHTHVSPYRLDAEALRAANPDLILTQEVCEVCALGAGSVFEVAAKALPQPPQILSLRASTLDVLLDEIVLVGAAAGVERRARRLLGALRSRLARLAERIGDAPRPRVLMMEWPEPPWCAGHWMADLARAAGGEDAYARSGEPSRKLSWAEVAQSGAEVLALMPCSYDLARTLEEAQGLALRSEVRRLPALRSGRFYALDGTVTARHGPRAVAVAEALASAFHPDRCGDGAWRSLVRQVPGIPLARPSRALPE